MTFRDCTAVLIPAHNDAYTLRFALAALRGNVDEVVVLDDCSVDETSEVLLEAKADCGEALRFIRHEGMQLGWSEARQRLLAATRARHVFTFDADHVLSDVNAGMLREIAAHPRPFAYFPSCEMWGDLRHATMRAAAAGWKIYDRSEVYVDRAWAPELGWAEDDQPCNLPAGAYPMRAEGPVCFHLKDVKPDARIVERDFFRAWMAAGRATGNSSDYAGLDHMTPEEAHRRAVRVLTTSKIDVPMQVWDVFGEPLRRLDGDPRQWDPPPRLPAVIRNAPQRFHFVYDAAGRIVDRVDEENRFDIGA